jgi:hypothetical protein
MTPARSANPLSDADVEKRARRARGYAFVAFGAGVTSLILVAISRIFGNPTPWTSWAFSILLTTNATVFLLPQSRRNPRAMALYYRLSTMAILVILVNMIAKIWRR